ncbi:MAG: phosphoribosylanthranilate isomerase, partial [Prevotella sp.]
MIIKISGMCDARNIREVSALDIDMMGFDFYPSSERFVQMISSQAGIVPDFSPERLKKATRPEETGNAMVPKRISRVGVFVDDMPQSIISRVYNYSLDFVQLNGDESEVMIDNLKRSLVPDLVPEIKVIKAFDICSTADFARCSVFESCTNLFLFN